MELWADWLQPVMTSIVLYNSDRSITFIMVMSFNDAFELRQSSTSLLSWFSPPIKNRTERSLAT